MFLVIEKHSRHYRCATQVRFSVANGSGLWGIDDIQFGVATVVSVPTAVWLFGSGLGLLGWMRRKQRNRSH
jgi:hypothetical protein